AVKAPAGARPRRAPDRHRRGITGSSGGGAPACPGADILLVVPQPATTELEPGIVRVTMPLPWALDHVHCYALAAPEGWTLVDAGLGTPQTLAWWDDVLHALGRPSVTQLVLTH